MNRSPPPSEPPIYLYRAYQIGSDGHIKNVTTVAASGDDEAIEIARQMVDGHAIELWDRARIVARLPEKPA